MENVSSSNKDQEEKEVCDQCGHTYSRKPSFEDVTVSNSCDFNCDCDNCIAYTLKESRDRWHREAHIIRDVFQLEKKLGRVLTWEELERKFDGRDIGSVSDMLS